MAKPTMKALMEEVDELRIRIDALEAARIEDAAKHLEVRAGDHAMREGLLQFTQEIAARDGHSVELFVTRFHAAIDWHRDRFLQMVEGIDPCLAAHIDRRELANIPTDDLPPYIFPV